MKVRKNIIKKAAKIYAASLLHYAMSSGADSELLNSDELNFLQNELDKIANRIMPETDVSTLDEAILLSIDLNPAHDNPIN